MTTTTIKSQSGSAWAPDGNHLRQQMEHTAALADINFTVTNHDTMDFPQLQTNDTIEIVDFHVSGDPADVNQWMDDLQQRVSNLQP